MRELDVREAVFGSFDGLTSALGVITGLIVAGAHSGPRVLAAALGLAVAATVGMGAGEYLSDSSRQPRLALVMALATFAGSLLPAIPFAVGYGPVQVAASGAIVIAGAALIGRYRGYRITFCVLLIVAAITVALSALVA